MFMKEIYEPAEMEVITFENEDVITTSNELPYDNLRCFSVQMNGDTLADFNQDFIPDDEEQ